MKDHFEKSLWYTRSVWRIKVDCIKLYWNFASSCLRTMMSMLYLLTSWNFFCIQLSQNNEVNVVFTNVVKFLLFIIILFITSLKATSVLVLYLWRNFYIRYDQKFENWKINCVRIEFNNQFQRRIYEGEVLRVYLI